jgi:hypothetical protein
MGVARLEVTCFCARTRRFPLVECAQRAGPLAGCSREQRDQNTSVVSQERPVVRAVQPVLGSRGDLHGCVSERCPTNVGLKPSDATPDAMSPECRADMAPGPSGCVTVVAPWRTSARVSRFVRLSKWRGRSFRSHEQRELRNSHECAGRNGASEPMPGKLR